MPRKVEFGGIPYSRRLRVDFLDTIDRTNFYANTTQSTAPLVNDILFAVSDDGIFRTNQIAAVARDTDGSNFKF